VGRALPGRVGQRAGRLVNDETGVAEPAGDQRTRSALIIVMSPAAATIVAMPLNAAASTPLATGCHRRRAARVHQHGLVGLRSARTGERAPGDQSGVGSGEPVRLEAGGLGAAMSRAGFGRRVPGWR